MVYENNHNASQKQILRTKLNSLAHVGCHLFNNSEIKLGSAKGYVLGYVQFSLPLHGFESCPVFNKLFNLWSSYIFIIIRL